MFKSRNPQMFRLFCLGIIRQGKAVAGIPIGGFSIEHLRKIPNRTVVIANTQGIISASDIVFDAGHQQKSD